MNEPAPHPHAFAGIFFGLLAYLCFSSSDTLIKFLSSDFTVYQIVATQTCFGLLVVLSLIPSRGGLGALKIKSKIVFFSRGISAGLGSLLAYFAFSKLPMTDVYAIIFCTPMIVTIMSVIILKEVVKIYRWSAVLVGFLGVVIMVRPDFNTLTLGHLACLLAAFTSAGSTLIMRKWGRFEHPLIMLIAVMMGFLMTSVPMLPFYFRMPNLLQLMMMAGSGILIASAQFFIIKAITSAPASTIAPLQYSQMIWGIIFGMLIFDEHLNRYMVIGMVLIVTSSLYTLHRERVHGRTLNAQIKR